LGISLVIAKIGIDIIRESSPTLMDQVVMSADQVEQIVQSVPGVVSCHKVRSRGHEGAVYADLHLRVDPGMSTEQSHAIAHEVQRRLRERRPDVQDVVIHVEPAGSVSEEKGWGNIAVQLRQLADGLGVGVHDVWAYEVSDDAGYVVEVHLEADGDLSLREAHALASSLEKRARAEVPHLAELITHIEPRGQLAQALDSGPSAPLRAGLEESQVSQMVQQVTNEVLDAQACHQVQVRRSDGGWAVSMHCHLPGEVSLMEAHRLGTQLETRLREKIAGLERVVIHTEPWEG
jgi:divalent metal cation (Fe/Co/Zn/Cd) transporter